MQGIVSRQILIAIITKFIWLIQVPTNSIQPRSKLFHQKKKKKKKKDLLKLKLNNINNYWNY